MHTIIRLFSAVLSAVTILLGPHFPAWANGNLNPKQVQLCHRAIDDASRAYGVPHDVLLAISLTETGKKIGGKTSPWPWTVNMEGAGVWFSSKREALQYVKQHYSRGARSFDVGCFQINYKWHRQHFRSLEEMFDPKINARYAAKYLVELYLETGSWSKAAGFYHSRTPQYYTKYAARFERYRDRINGQNASPAFLGHGSEPLKADREKTAKVQSGERLPLINLTTPSLTQPIHLGSLVSRSDGETGLLTRAARPLF